MRNPDTARPIFLELHRLRYPVGAVASIGHRISGVVLALAAPALVYVLDLSLSGEQGYARAAALLDSAAAKLGAVLLAWAFAHHFFAGLRHLLMDVDVGSALPAARRSAWLASAAGAAVALVVAWRLW